MKKNINPYILEVHSVSKTIRNGRHEVKILNEINLSFERGKFTVLTGPSGSGKSTLLQILGGLDRPTSGSILFENIALNKLSDRRLSNFRSKKIGFIFQFFYLQPFLTIFQNISVPVMFSRMKAKDRRERIAQLAMMVGMEDKLKLRPSQLSGGQIQRVAIIRALMNAPDILLADEPTGNLDSNNREGVINLLLSLRDEYDMTIIMATHEQSIVARADRVIHIQDGNIV